MNVKLIKLFDKVFGIPICIILGVSNLLPKIKKTKEIKNILIIQLWGIGETILTLPAIKELRKKFPKANISILATKRNADIYSNLNLFNKLIIISLNPFSIKWFLLKNLRKYDLVIDMEEYLNISAIMSFFIGKNRIGYSHGIRSLLYTDKIRYNDKQHISQTFMDLIDQNIKVKSLIELAYSKNDEKIINEFITKNKIKKNDFVAGLVPGAAESSKSRMWPKENFAELADNLIEKKNAKIIFIGADYEKDLMDSVINRIKNKSNVINTAGLFTLKQTFCLIKKLRLLVANDTGPMHIGAAQGTKTIGLFGPNLPIRFGPLNKKSKSIYKPICKFSPCINVHKGKVPECFYDETSRDYQKCMKEIKVKDVLRFV